jgi:ABC-type sugar transport system permease subunit
MTEGLSSASGPDRGQALWAHGRLGRLMWGRLLGSTIVASLLFLLPALIILIVFRLVPIEQAFHLSFTRWNGAGEPEWIGLANFEQVLRDPVFWAALRNNLLVLLFLPLWVIAPLLIAAILHSGVPGAKFFRLMVFLPAVLSPVVIGAYFNVLLKYNGALNTFLRDIGFGAFAHQWLNDPNTVLATMVLIFIWATLGIGALIFLAALAQVNPELYDAAEIDGASWWRRQRDITIPETRRTIEFWAVFVMISTFTTVFPFVFTLTRGGPGYSTYLLDYYVYDAAFFGGSFGYASAIGMVLLIIVSGVCGLSFWLLRRGTAR